MNRKKIKQRVQTTADFWPVCSQPREMWIIYLDFWRYSHWFLVVKWIVWSDSAAWLSSVKPQTGQKSDFIIAFGTRIHPRRCFVFRLCSLNHYRFQSWVHILLSEAGGDCIVALIPAGCLQFMYTEEAKHRLGRKIQLLPLGSPRCCLLGFFFHLLMRFTFQTHLWCSLNETGTHDPRLLRLRLAHPAGLDQAQRNVWRISKSFLCWRKIS